MIKVRVIYTRRINIKKRCKEFLFLTKFNSLKLENIFTTTYRKQYGKPPAIAWC